MSIIHIDHHEVNFAIIDKACLEDSRLSWRATGLHSYLMGLPHDWSINVKDLANRKSDGRTSVGSAIQELERFGYIVKRRTQDKKGMMAGWDYTVYEKPIKTAIPTESSLTEIGLPEIGQPAPTKDTEDTKDTKIHSKVESEASIKSNPVSEKKDSKHSYGPFFAAWKNKCGGQMPSWCAKHFKALVEENDYGIVLAAFREYLKNTETNFCSVPSFAMKFGFWKQKVAAPAQWSDPNRFKPH